MIHSLPTLCQRSRRAIYHRLTIAPALVLAIVLAIVLALGFRLLASADEASGSGDRPARSAVVVPVIRVQQQMSYPLEQVFVGQVEARRTAELGVERAGQLIEVRVREGDSVRAGDLLARLDPTLLQAKRAELSADLASAEADLALAEVTAERYRDSVKGGAVTRQDLDEASEGARAASARLQLAKARIASIDLDLVKTELSAPFDGTVVQRMADEGTVLGAGQPVLTLQETAAPEVRVGVAGPLLGALLPGEHYRLEIDGEDVNARLRAIIPLRIGTSRTVDALFDPIFDKEADDLGSDRAGADGRPHDPTRTWALRPGNLAELRLRKQVEAQGYWLPLSALSEGDRGLWRALVAEPETDESETANIGIAPSSSGASEPRWCLVSRPVQVLHVDRERAFVRGPLQPDDPVVAAGLHRVVPGQRVRIVQSTSLGAYQAD